MAKKKADGLKITKFSAENFKSLTNVTFDVGGKSFTIVGKNGAGKSSLLQVMQSPLDSKVIPTKPIKEGEDRSTISVTIEGEVAGEFRRYIADLYFTPANNRGRLVITNEKNEAVKSPSTVMKTIIGNISFNIWDHFLNADKKKRIELLKELTGKKVEIDLAEIDIDTRVKAKTKLSDKITDDEASLKNHGFTPDEIEKYSEPMDMVKLQEELSGVSTSIDNYNRIESGVRQFKVDIEGMETYNQNAEKQIKELAEQIERNNQEVILTKTKLAAGEKWLEAKEKPSAESISKKMMEASVHNTNCDKVKEFAKKQLDLINAKKQLDTMASDIVKAKKAKDKIISTSELPIEGLTFSDEEILLNGIPLEEGGVNTAKLIDTGIAIYAAINKNLRTIFIPEASLLDNETKAKIEAKWVDELDYQIIYEQVTEDQQVELHFLETKVAE